MRIQDPVPRLHPRHLLQARRDNDPNMSVASLSRRADPIVAIVTAPGRGAVGIVRLSGRNLSPLIPSLCGRSLEPRKSTLCPLLDASGAAIDRGLALFFPAPQSYTGEDVLELQAHGGPVVLQLLVARCLEAGAGLGLRLAEPGEFTERAFLNDKLDLAQAEAVADLIDASTEAAARSAGRALAGALSAEVQAMVAQLVRLRTLVEATLDFPEEEIDFLQQAGLRDRLATVEAQLQALLQRARQGALLREGLRVVLAGQPNVGKSSLLNALAGAELAIVTAIPGTTRDRVSESIQIQGVPLHITDTAGLREQTQDEVERIGIARSWQAIGDADAIIFLHDLTRRGEPGYEAGDAGIAARLPAHRPVLHVHNKADAVSSGTALPGIVLSALTGQGLDALRDDLLQAAGWQGAAEGLFIARTRHVTALRSAAAHLAQASAHAAELDQSLELLAEDLRLAHESLGAITGEFSADDLLGEIFRTFCIGK